jgi:collagenase-like PrtC family protease
MKFALGYQQSEDIDDRSFIGLVDDYREHLAEVYFPWVGTASGRAALGRQRGVVEWRAQQRLEDDLAAIRDRGIKLDLLFNANCYGARAVSEQLQHEVGSILEYLETTVGGVDIVTTTSLAVARTVKKYFPTVEVRASVNMKIESAEAMSYVAGLFDSFYLCRDVQRDLEDVRQVRQWCDENGKELCLLANSGCLYRCPGQIFHDNMVAHDAEIDEMKNVKGWTPHVCWNLYRRQENWPAILKATWIRPEDLHHYEGLADVVKLATRMHSRPRAVLEAYTSGKWRGNLLDLLEPGFAPAFDPQVIDNDKFPDDWFEKTSTCARNCQQCGYCAQVLEQVLMDTSGYHINHEQL